MSVDVYTAGGGNSLGSNLSTPANGVDVRNLANPQKLRIFNTTDAGVSNYEALQLDCESNVFTIQNVHAGTGSARQLRVQSDSGIQLNNGGFDVLSINSTSISPSADGGSDIGSSSKGFGHVFLSVAANKSCGTASLTAGTVTISNTSVTANSKIFCMWTGTGTLTGFLKKGTITAGTSIVVSSSVGTDTAQFDYIIVN